jgi:uncharacterized delta-60 repeat protein
MARAAAKALSFARFRARTSPMNRFAHLALLPALATAAAHADGGLDPAFGAGGIARIDEIQPVQPAVAVQPDGRILVCDETQGDGTGYDFYVVRFDPDGTRDATFGTGGALAIPFDAPDYGEDFCRGIAIDADGHIVVAGYRILADFPDPELDAIAVARINPDGTLDDAFADAGRLSFAFEGFDRGGRATSVAIDAEHRIVIAGTVKAHDYAQRVGFARIESDGTFDPTFGSGGQATVAPPSADVSDAADAVAVDAQGRVLVAGSRNGDGMLMRLAPDGSLDATFGDGGIAMGGLAADAGAGSFAALAIDSAGRAVAAGQHRADDGSLDMIGARFLPDGSHDSAFGDGGIAVIRFDLGPQGGGQGGASALAIAGDGKLVLAGNAARAFPDGLLGTLARLDENGALDPTFGQDGKATFDVSAFTQSDQWLTGVAMQGARIVAVGGNIDFNAGRQGDFVIRIAVDRIFAGSFD